MIGMEIRIHSDEEGLSPLEILKKHLPAAPSGYLRQLLRSGKVRLGETPLSEQARLAGGEVLRLPRSERLQELRSDSESEKLDILYESREILAVCKPSGLAVHRGVGHERDNLVLRIESLMAKRGASFRTSPVHRLDLETSGPVLFGKGRRAAGELGKAFMAGAAEKLYWGLASGRLEGPGQLRTPVYAKGKVKESATDFTVIAAHGDFSLLQMRLRSGRTHQIRRQLADAGHPLACDGRYGGVHLPVLQRLFLHCCRLSLTNPFDGHLLELECPLPADLSSALQALGFDSPRGSFHSS
jgi:23S rRNA pseudouridine955/2504/2580 synthase